MNNEITISRVIHVNFTKMYEESLQPMYATIGAACFDIFAYVDPSIYPSGMSIGYSAIIDTGIKIEVPQDHVLMVYSRSGHGFKNDVRLSNCVGVIDSDYRGELKIKLTNDSSNPFTNGLIVKTGDRIAQGMVIPISRVFFNLTNKLSDTQRGSGGFGSTGV